MKNKVYVFTKKQMCDICRAECAEQDGLIPDCDNCTTKYLPNMDRVDLTKKIIDVLTNNGKNARDWFVYSIAVKILNAILGE